MEEKWCENIIIVDADYVDSVAFDLVVNFERMIGRRIPNADMAQWIDCVALDGKVTEGEQQTQVIFIHKKEKTEMRMFAPGNFEEDLNGKAFKDNLGEFLLSSYPVEDMTTTDDFILDVLKTAANHKDVKRIMVVANCDDGTMPSRIRNQEIIKSSNLKSKIITVFAMQPINCGDCRQEILGYSLMAALGVRSEELRR